MNKKTKKIIIFVILIILLFVIGLIVLYKAKIVEKRTVSLEETQDITIVPTMKDKITKDSSWCGTFQLIWNDLKNEIAGQDIVFDSKMQMVDNLNLGEFNENMISDEYYYKKYGLKTLALKEEIEKGIYEKFNEKSDFLDNFDWSEKELHGSGEHDYRFILYVMLYRKFEFLQKFDKLENGNFGEIYNDIKYFGIDENTKSNVGNQIKVLYYNSKNDFAISINTKTDDEVIFCKNPNGSDFNTIYNNMNKESQEYKGSKNFENIDEFKAPYLIFNIMKEYNELEGKNFETSIKGAVNGEEGRIEKAIQSIKFTLDENGGEIKSEGIMTATFDSALIEDPKKEKPRYFYVDDTFAIFLKEKSKEKPYFAGRIENIKKFQ